MKKLNINEIKKYVLDNIGIFHEMRIKSIDKLNISNILKRKNPYLFKAKNVLTSEQIIRGIVDAHISSSEETILGNWLEGLAIFINGKVYGGKKSGIKGVDLEFEKDGKRNIVNIKSGPNWGNSTQIEKMITDFKTAKKTIRTSNSKIDILAINGCCYGKENNIDKGEYYKYCGQDFWEFISGDNEIYIKIIEPIGYKAKEKNDYFLKLYSQKINILTIEFSKTFCKKNGEINWEKLVEFNSGKNKI